MRMNREYRSKRGFALGWVTLTLLIVMVLLLFCLTVAGGYTSRDIRQYDRVQAEFTSKTVAEAIAMDMKKPAVEGSIRGILEAAAEESEPAVLVLDGLDSDMGQVTLHVAYEEDETMMSVAVHTVLRQEKAVVILYMKQNGAEDGWKEAWYGSDMEWEA